MKGRFLIFLGFLSISLVLFISCFDYTVDGGGEDVIVLRINFGNNTDLTIDCKIKGVIIGPDGLENTEDIFKSEKDWLDWKERWFDDWKRHPKKNEINTDFYSPPWYKIDTFFPYEKIEGGVILPKRSADWIIEHRIVWSDLGYPLYTHRWFTSLLIELNFRNGEKSYLVGYPKDYYSKIEPEPEKYGFWMYWDRGGLENIKLPNSRWSWFDYSSNKFYEIKPWTPHSLKFVIDNTNDIKMMRLPESGKKVEKEEIKAENGKYYFGSYKFGFTSY